MDDLDVCKVGFRLRLLLKILCIYGSVPCCSLSEGTEEMFFLIVFFCLSLIFLLPDSGTSF